MWANYVGLFADIGKATGTSPVTPAQPGVVRNLGLVDPLCAEHAQRRSGQSLQFGPRRGSGRSQQPPAARCSGSLGFNGGAVLGVQNTNTPTAETGL